MKLSYNWLKEFIPTLPWTPEEVAEKLTMSGTEVESLHPAWPELEGVVVGHLEEVRLHPEAKNLKVCQVNIGQKRLQTVCGAPNVKSGQRIAFALPGAKLPHDSELKEAQIKGTKSAGMICSEKELGIGEVGDIILVLEESVSAGTSLARALRLKDSILELEVTPNRPDCLSHLGIARELCALGGGKLRLPENQFPEAETETASEVEVEIEDEIACPRYTARIIKGVGIKPSPKWMALRLESLGIRSISNVVDVTNWVLLETGHPLHAFDYDNFAQRRVLVRRAKPGERFLTLDGVGRTLSSNSLLITDGETPVAIAGIMGGEKSEVSGSTRNILLESAYFDPPTTRRASRELGLVSESSYRFERGADPENVVFASKRATRLIQELAGGEVLKGLVDCYPRKIVPPKVKLRPQRVSTVVGIEIPKEKSREILTGLGFKVEGEEVLEVSVPSYRPDITREIDLIEEIARILNYDNIPAVERPGGELVTPLPEGRKLARTITEILCGRGFFEIVTYIFEEPRKYRVFGGNGSLVRLLNPISEELSILRPNLTGSLLETTSHNLNRYEKNIRIFEIGKVYFKSGEGKFRESWRLAAAMSGDRERRHWSFSPTPVDLFDLKGELEGLLERLHLPEVSFRPKEGPIFEAAKGFDILSKDQCLGEFGKIAEEVLKAFNLKEAVFSFEIDLEKLTELFPREKRYQALPKFPPVDRDIAIVVDHRILAGEIQKSIRELDLDSLEEISLFDQYVGRQIPPGKKSLAFSIRYRSSERTLTEKEVESSQTRLVQHLKAKFGAQLRS
jgi:phenylalanyl-tRNA synthetase beta chain